MSERAGPQGSGSRPHNQTRAGKKRARLRFNSARRLSLHNDSAATRQNVERGCPATPPSQIKTQTYSFFRAGRALSRPRRRANNPSTVPDVVQTHLGPAQAPLLAAPERGRLIAQGPRFHIPPKARALMRRARRRDVYWKYMGACGTRHIRFRNLQRSDQSQAVVPQLQVWPGRCVLKHISPGPTPQASATARRPPGRRRSRWSWPFQSSCRPGCPGR